MGLPRSNLVKSKSTPVHTPAPASGVRALEVATTCPQLTSPFAPPPAENIDVVVNISEVGWADADLPDNAPSSRDLVERAARLGPARPSFQSIVLPNDPVLAEKMQPHAAERRARFQKIVKATLGACVAVCVAALIATAFSPSEGSSLAEGSASSAPETSSLARTAPATVTVSIEKLDGTTRGKAVTHRAAAATAKVRARAPKKRR